MCEQDKVMMLSTTLLENISSLTQTESSNCIKDASPCQIACSDTATICCPPVAADYTQKPLVCNQILQVIRPHATPPTKPCHALLTSLFWLFGGSASNATALQAKGGVHLSCAPGSLLHLLYVSFHQLSRHFLTHTGKLLCRPREDIYSFTI